MNGEKLAKYKEIKTKTKVVVGKTKLKAFKRHFTNSYLKKEKTYI